MSNDEAKNLREAFRALVMYPSLTKNYILDIDAAATTLKSLCETVSKDNEPIDDGLAIELARYAPGALWPGCTYGDATRAFKPEIEMWVRVSKLIKGEA